jgi:NitT/TauT family transport system permease protein
MTVSLTAAAVREAGARCATKRRNLAIRLGSVVALLLVWEICGMLTPRIFLSPFHETVVAFWRLCRDGTLVAPTLSSLSVLFAGFAVSVLLGVPLGLLMGRYVRLNWAPLLMSMDFTPRRPWRCCLCFPLAQTLRRSKVAIVVLLAIFPIIKNTYAGVATVGQELLEPAS